MEEIQQVEYRLTGPDADARGILVDDGFLVRSGSLARRETVPSGKSVRAIHQQLIADGVLQEHNGQLQFIKDHRFKSPSGAAAAVLGRMANGWISWKRADGLTLSEVRRVSRDHQVRILNDEQRREISAQHQQLVNDGKLSSRLELEKEYALFREKFGPQVLAAVDGEALLTLMHDHNNRDSLVYWLEFKNDDEFASPRYGSIAGGSALKFRIFRRKESGLWQKAGEKSYQPKDIPIEEAIVMAREHRDQLLHGAELLAQLSEHATDEDYAELQDQMDELAPDVSRLGWGHKYFSLLFPNKLDDYHSPDWQRFHLLKLLQMPPEGNGRYICAGRFLAAAKEVDLPINHFTATLNSIHGRLHRYWRIGTTHGGTGESFWGMMQERSCIAVGWNKLGDVGWIDSTKESRERLRILLAEQHPNHSTAIGREVSQLVHFVADMAEGDVVLAADGMKILGVGQVRGDYEYQSEFEFPHHRKVDWISTEPWQLPESKEGLQSTVRALGKSNENLLAIERRMRAPIKYDGGATKLSTPTLLPIPTRIQSILDRKGQVILYGPPGTGKTYWAEQTARNLAALSAFGKLFEQLDEPQRLTIVGGVGTTGLVRLCCFHPGYGYEDFLEGYRPVTANGNVAFELRDGIFKTLCKDAAAAPKQNFYLVIDEINRGDIPRIFGELLTTLEKDKREKQIILPVSQQAFSVPKNVFLIGTMNTADRSISLLDAALRRRFGFVELMPDASVLKGHSVAGIALSAWLDALNTRIRQHVGRDARNLQIGHSYLLHAGKPHKDVATFKRAIRDDIIPLLEEYCYEEYSTLEKILGDQLIHREHARVCHELFDDGKEDYLIQALLALCPEIVNSSEAIVTAGMQEESENEAVEPTP